MRLLRLPGACEITGYKRASFYAKVKARLIPKPVLISNQTVAWPEPELIAINRARVAGRNNDEIRALVQKLEAQRARASPDVKPKLARETRAERERAARADRYERERKELARYARSRGVQRSVRAAP